MPKAPPKPKGLPRRIKLPIQRIRQGQYTLPLLSLQHERLIGRTIMAWNRIDAVLQSLLWEFLNVGMSDGRIITARLDVGTVVQMLRALANRHVLPDYLETYLTAFNLVDDLREDRNLLAHATWGLMKPESVPIAMSLKPEGLPGEVVSEAFAPSRMYGIIKAMDACHLTLVSFHDDLQSSRDKFLRRLPKD
jgi:hypothetical protein